jgi:hypothetical protein
VQTLRIFISSPGDVADERQIAGKVIERLQGKYWSFVRLDDVFWEKKVIRSTAHYQDELVNPGDCEMVVGILWSRLGSLMPEKFRKASGERYDSGTEWELEMAFEAYEQSLVRTGDPVAAKPDIVIYRRNQPPPQFTDPEQVAQATAPRLQMMSRASQWRAARSWWQQDGAGNFPSLRVSYLRLLLTRAGNPAATAVPSALGELTEEVTVHTKEAADDIGVSVSLSDHLLRRATDAEQCPEPVWQGFLDKVAGVTREAWRECVVARITKRLAQEEELPAQTKQCLEVTRQTLSRLGR